MKNTLFIALGTVFMLAGSTFASGAVTSGSTLTGNVNTGTVFTGTTTGHTNTWTVLTGTINTWALCLHTAAQVRNDALKAIEWAFTTNLKKALDKKDAAIAAARASGKSEEAIKALIRSARDTWKSDMKAAMKTAKEVRKAAKETFEKAKKTCKGDKKEDKHERKDRFKNKLEERKNDDNSRKGNGGGKHFPKKHESGDMGHMEGTHNKWRTSGEHITSADGIKIRK
jgi:hypothetical protein